jgi:hypothetical protein
MHSNATRPRSRSFTERGNALLATMLLVLVLSPLAAFVAMQSQLDLKIHDHTRTALEAFYVAESGLEHALADLALEPSFERLGRGPDRRPGTADDRLYPFRVPPPVNFPAPPAGYRVEVEAVGSERFDVVSLGRSHGRSQRTVSATVVAGPDPYVPGALSLAEPNPLLDLRDGFSIVGNDDVPAVAVEDENDVDVILTFLTPTAQQRLVGPDGEAPSIRTRSSSSASDLFRLLSQLPTSVTLPDAVAGPLGTGVCVAAQSTRISDADGAGFLVIDGDLSIGGQFEFDGFLLVLGDVEVDDDASVDIDGALLQAPPGDEMRLRGEGEISYDATALRDADRLAPGVLPRRAVVTAWSERLS